MDRIKRVPAVARLVGASSLLVAALPSAAFAASLHLHVRASAGDGGDGSALLPFNDLVSAVDAGRQNASRYSEITISVEPGEYTIRRTIQLDYSVKLQGSAIPVFDADGWPTDTSQPGSETILKAAESLGNSPVLLVTAAADASNVAGVSVAGFTVVGTARQTSQATVIIQKAQGFAVSEVLVNSNGAFSGVYILAASGAIKKSYVSGAITCGICLGAGNEVSPATVDIVQNRLVQNGSGALLLAGTAYPLPEIGDLLTVRVLNNDLSRHTTGNQGFGIRIFTTGTVVPMPQTSGSVIAKINGNRIADNRYGLIIDAGFPRRNIAGTCGDTRRFTGRIAVKFHDNVVARSAVTPALLTFTRAQVFLNPTGSPLSAWQYLHGASFSIDDPGLSLGGVIGANAFQIDHPYVDPFDNAAGTGTCQDDEVREPLENLLSYNGVTINAPIRNF